MRFHERFNYKTGYFLEPRRVRFNFGIGSSSSKSKSRPVYWSGTGGLSQQDMLGQASAYLSGKPWQTVNPAYTTWQNRQSGDSNRYGKPDSSHYGNALINDPAPEQYITAGGVPAWAKYLEEGQKPYAGDLSAPLSGGETSGYKTLMDFKPTDLTGKSSQYLTDLLSGKHAPGGEMFAGMDQARMDILDKQLAQSNRAAAMGGMRYSSPNEIASGQLRRGAVQDLSALRYGAYQKDMENRLAALDPAMRLEQAPLDRATQRMAAGGAVRTIEQQALDRKKEEWLRQLQAMGIPFQTAMQLMMWSPATGTTAGSSGWNFNAGYGTPSSSSQPSTTTAAAK